MKPFTSVEKTHLSKWCLRKRAFDAHKSWTYMQYLELIANLVGGMVVSLIDVARLANLPKAKMTPCFRCRLCQSRHFSALSCLLGLNLFAFLYLQWEVINKTFPWWEFPKRNFLRLVHASAGALWGRRETWRWGRAADLETALMDKRKLQLWGVLTSCCLALVQNTKQRLLPMLAARG